MESFTPIYAITYAIWNSTENLRVAKEGYFRVLVFAMFPYSYRNTGESLGELDKARKQSSCELMFPLQFLILPNFHSCFYNSMKTRKMFSIS